MYQTKASMSQSEGILFSKKWFLWVKSQEFGLKDGDCSLSFLSVRGLVGSYQAGLSDLQIPVLSRKGGCLSREKTKPTITINSKEDVEY